MQAVVLFGYAFISNFALSVLPHEPALIWYGTRLGVWATTLIASAGTLAAAFVDHRVFGPLILRVARRRSSASVERFFNRAPFAFIALSGLTPLPFFPFKALAFASGYPLGRYLAAVALRCLPRYALLAWLGFAVSLPPWLLATLFVALLIPSVRTLRWRPSAS